MKSEENYLLDLIEHTASAESIMTNKKKSKGQKDGFMKKVSSLFNIDMVKTTKKLHIELDNSSKLSIWALGQEGEVCTAKTASARAMKLTSGSEQEKK